MHPSASPVALPGLGVRYAEVREASLQIAEGLEPEDCVLQSMPDASPLKWHLAHTTWFFETFILERFAARHRPFRAEFRDFYNSYYNAIGAQFPRMQRGLISRPNLAEVLAYRQAIDAAMQDLLQGAALPAEARAMIALGLNHEQQHQELMLTDLKHLLSLNPFSPAYRDSALAPSPPAAASRWRHFEGGIAKFGHAGGGFSFDNELPRHRQYISPFEISSRPVTNAEYRDFVEDGGYTRADLWLSEGWQAVSAQRWTAPLYWRKAGERWREFTLRGLQPLDPERPVAHVSHYEADAYARWAALSQGPTRLPTEFEWEFVAAQATPEGNFLESGELHPRQTGGGDADRTPGGMFGDVWEWTSSSYAAYPGFRPASGAVGEYNGKFMANQYVLRGGSCATPRSHIRATYRNFFPSTARWQFSGVRLARDPA